MKTDNFVVIQGWMCNELNLKGNDLLVFALIYGFSQDGDSRFHGSRGYIADTFNISLPTVDKALSSLVEKSLLEKHIITEPNGSTHNEYSVRGVVKKLYRGSKETLQGGSKETLHNNTNIEKHNDIYIPATQGGTMSHECPKDVPQILDIESETENIDIDRDNIPSAKAVATRESIPKEEVDEIIRLWNEIPEVNNVVSISKTSQRYKSLSARIKEFSYDTVIEAIRLVSVSDFLRGKINSFKITFDWFVKPNNFVKIIEGNYNPKNTDNKNDETKEEHDAYQG